ncbi:glycosyl transferase [Pseudomonas oryzihabitans]|nr:glycosyl transferase [Pseudomonas psychrotolerans]
MNDFSQPRPAIPDGRIESLHGGVLQGWACDLAQPDLRLALEVMIDGAIVALVRADEYQSGPCVGDGFHGFAIQLRETWLADARQISVRVANGGAIVGHPLELPLSPACEPSLPGSQVWYGGGLLVTGWLWSAAAPGLHKEVRARLGDRIIARCRADLWHPALSYRPDADHGFRLELPWTLGHGERHEIHIEDDQGVALKGSPISVCCQAEGLGALLEAGWPEQAAPELRELALRLAQDYGQRCPRSAGFGHYPYWFALHQRLPAFPAQVASRQIAVLLYGDAQDYERHACLDSLSAQRLAPSGQKIATTDFAGSLRQLVEEGADAVLLLPFTSRLLPQALDQLALGLLGRNDDPPAAWAFADCDQDQPDGSHGNPWFKPSWDLDLYLGTDLFCEAALFGRTVILQALATLEQTAGKHRDREAVLAALVWETVKGDLSVARVSQVLSHRSALCPATPAECDAQKPERLERMNWLLERLQPGSYLSRQHGLTGALRAHWPLPARLPKVSLIVPTRNAHILLQACMEGLLEGTDYPALELIVIDNQSDDPATLDYFETLKTRGVRVLEHPYPFNYATLNNRGVEIATGEYVGFINNDIEVLSPDWLKEMVSLAARPDVGAVGAKLLWKNGMVQHAGVVVGINGLAAHTGNHWLREDAGYLGFNQLTRQQSACTTACLLMRRDLYLGLEGMDAQRYPVAFNDVDLCLRIDALGLKVLWTPFAELIHAESATRGKDNSSEKAARAQREQRALYETFSSQVLADRFYSPSLNQDWALGPYGGLNLALGRA